MSSHHMSDTVSTTLYALSNLMQMPQWGVVVITFSTEEVTKTETLGSRSTWGHSAIKYRGQNLNPDLSGPDAHAFHYAMN